MRRRLRRFVGSVPRARKSSTYVCCGEHAEFDRGLSQEQLAFEADMHRTYVSGIERGGRNLTATVLQRLATALGSAIGDLFV